MLLQAKGNSEKPKDFEEYWDEAIAEMRAVDPCVKLVSAEFATPFADCFHLYFTGVGGSRIHAKYVRPKQGEQPHPAVLQFHGYTANSGDWIPMLSYAAAGMSYFAMDCRGQGGLSEELGGAKGPTVNGHVIRGIKDEKEKLLYRSMYLDTALLAQIAASFPEVDENRIGAIGGSQGGALAIACAALSNIKRIAPIYPFLCDIRYAYETSGNTSYNEIVEYFRRHDPEGDTTDEVFEKLSYIDLVHLAPRVKAEVFMQTALKDNICLPETQFAAYNAMPGKKQARFYPEYYHEWIQSADDKVYQFMMGL
ncbi:MAG: acetylesterase [Clostridiales bacterium 43-6]|nr:MAG: acetylesterase [Clostridiales bacterium 43-6]